MVKIKFVSPVKLWRTPTGKRKRNPMSMDDYYTEYKYNIRFNLWLVVITFSWIEKEK